MTVLLAAVVLLEIVPVAAWLLTIAGLSSSGIEGTAAPFWFLILALVAFGVLAARLSAHGEIVRIVAASCLGLALLALALRVSPSMYGNVPEGVFGAAWLHALATDLATGSSRLGAVALLFLLIAYLAWRGILLGREMPDTDAVLDRFKPAMISIVATVLIAVVAQGPARQPLLGILALLLPLLVFSGLVAAAVASVRQGIAHGQTGVHAPPRGRTWLAASIGLAASVVGIVFLATLVFSTASVEAALGHLGVVGQALDAALHWVSHALEAILNALFAPTRLLQQNSSSPPPESPQNLPPTTSQQQSATSWAQFGAFLLNAATVVALIAAIIWATRFVVRVLLARRRSARPAPITEEREALDGRSLFREQLRGMLASLRRRGRGAGRGEDLARGSARWLFREVLRAAAGAGMERAAAETPDEYTRRLAALFAARRQSGGLAEDSGTDSGTDSGMDIGMDIGALGDAYDAARYGETEPPPAERPTLRARSGRIVSLLNARTESREGR